MSPVAASAALVITFAVHSSLMVALVWLLCRWMRAPAQQEALWKLALWLPFVSSPLQLFGLGAPLLDLPALLRSTSRLLAAPAAAPKAALDLGLDFPPDLFLLEPASTGLDPAVVVVAVAAVLGGVGLLWLLRARLRLSRCLAHRLPLGEARILATAARVARDLGLRQTPQLSCSGALPSPIAFGWLRPEVCLPSRAVALADGELRAMLTHEVSHLIRRDPCWLWLSALATAVAPWQPLLLLARRRLLHLAEVQCDAAAIQQGDGVTVARCLLEVAGWHCETQAPIGALSMAARGQWLRDRVERALAPPRPPRRLSRAAGAALAGLLLAALTAAAPGAAWDPAVSFEVVESEPLAGGADLDAQLRALDLEAASLQRQVATLRAGLGGLATDPDFSPQLQELQRRLTTLEQLRARLQTWRGVSVTPKDR